MEMDTVDATGLEASEVLAELYNNSKPLGMGIYQYKAEVMDTNEASLLLSKGKKFDYVFGRYMKVDFSNYPLLNPGSFDSQYGEGTMKKLVDNVRNNIASIIIPRDMPTQQELDETIEKCQINVTSLDLSKTVMGNSLNKFDKVWFIDSFCKELEEMGLPYPYDWCMYMETNGNRARFLGSMGGGFEIDVTSPIIKHVSTN